MAWDVEYTDEFGRWWYSPDIEEQAMVDVAVNELAAVGPSLGRPFVDTLKGSRHSNLKELRPPTGHLRVIFAFDPRRSAILLLGGDKSGRWKTWYATAIPEADDLYDMHLDELRKEGEGR